ncbi:E3 ubiquitin-protein ligase [Aspergillus undulatus]|uniref:E3 ubiquitin-protein ligase n=1 Tax=Aspergillus undulatus TaxID=1810928 RepID=UPI003CCD238F
MRKFVRYLGGEKGGSNYHSIWAVPAPESGSRAVATKRDSKRNDSDNLSLSSKKPQSRLHISKLNQPAVAELSSPTDTTSTLSRSKGPESIAELSATSDAQVSELDEGIPIHGAEPRVHTGVRDDGNEHGRSRAERQGEAEDDEELSRTQILRPDPPMVDPAPTPQPEPEHKHSPDRDLFIFSDEMDAIPAFGRQFGIAPTSIIREQDRQPEPEPQPEPQPLTKRQTGSKSPEAFFQQVDEELEALYTDYLKSYGKKKSKSSTSESTKKVKRSWTSKLKQKAADRPTVCIICLEPFSADGVRAPDTLSIACQHTPSVCYICLSKSIKHDLETKFWDEIKCPECNTLFIHDDVKRFADEETFRRYDKLSLRHAVTADKNFIWCLECDFGQLHEPGPSQPLVRCLSCAAESCFKHAIKWHDGFTCDEYDAVLWDPDSYKTIKAKNAAAGNGEDEKPEPLSKTKMARAKKKEAAKQEKLHEDLKKAARRKQEEEAARVREEKKLAKAQGEGQPDIENQNAEEEESETSTSQEDVKDDFKEKIEMLKKRMREVELSMKMVEETTKKCPGCQWPIEKNEGCDHMTCIKCRQEFCWICLKDWNSHTRRCRR